MNKWSVVGLLSCLGVASLAQAHAASHSSAAAVRPRASRSASTSGLPRTLEGASRPRQEALRLGGDMPCIAPQLVREDQGLGAYQAVPAAGGTFTMLVWTQLQQQCGLGVTESSAFVGDLKGIGTERVTYTVQPNSGAARTALIVATSGGQASNFEIRQAAATQPTTPPTTQPSTPPTTSPSTPPATTALSSDTSVLGTARTCSNIAMSIVKSGAALKPGTWVLSPSRQYKLIYQTDGNLVLYRASGEVLWANGKLTPNGQVKMQSDGNLVSYDAANKALWATGTRIKDSVLAVQDDGNIVVYGATGCTASWARR